MIAKDTLISELGCGLGENRRDATGDREVARVERFPSETADRVFPGSHHTKEA